MKERRSWLLMGLVLVALILLVVAALLAWQLREQYESQLIQQVWPAGMVRRPVVNGPTQGQAIVLLVGDSRMAQWGGITVSNRTVVNAGQLGATTGQLRLQLPELLDEFHPATVVFQAGINDLKLIGLKPELATAIVAQAVDNLSNMVAQCSARGCRVILLETWPVGQPEWLRRPVWNAGISVAVARLNEQLRPLDEPSKRVAVLDIFKAAGIVQDQKQFRDALHFQREVYQYLTPVLQKNLAERETK